MAFKFGRTYAGRMVFKIDIGDIDENDVEEYVRLVANKFKKTPIIDVSGSMGKPYEFLPFERDYFIPVRSSFPDITIIDHISLLTP